MMEKLVIMKLHPRQKPSPTLPMWKQLWFWIAEIYYITRGVLGGKNEAKNMADFAPLP